MAARSWLGALLRAAIITAAAAGALPTTVLADASPAQVIAAVNAERARNGIPAGIVENADWSRGCALHNAYRRLNGISTTGHDETPGLPGSTPEGDEAGNASVLATRSWSAGNPFATAPIHLMQLLAPRITSMGADDSDGLVCVSTFRGQGPASAADVVLTAPGDGRRDVPASEEARESPFAPGDLLVPPAAAVTGPHILVLADGPFAEGGMVRIVRARLRGPAGRVGVRTLDGTEPRIAGYIPPGGMVIPSLPLADGTRYTATVLLEGAGGVRLKRTWSFRTQGPAVPTAPRARGERGVTTGSARLRVAVHGRRLVVRGPRVLRGRGVRIAVTRRGATRRRTVVLAPSATLPLRRAEARPGTRISVRTSRFTDGGVRWSVPPVRLTVAPARR